MDSDDRIVGTILSRREVLGQTARAGLGMAMGGLLLKYAEAAYQEKAAKTVQLIASPAVTEGPFFVDEKLQRSNLLTGTTRPAVVQGVPLDLTLQLYRLTNGTFSPLQGAVVDIWHADAEGVYSDESHPMNHEDTAGQKWLRGYQVSDANGSVRFKTIFPGWYEGRTTHIHFKVRQSEAGKTGATAGATTREFTSQLFFEDALADKIFARAPYRERGARQARNKTDMVYTEPHTDGAPVGDRLLLNIQPVKAGYAASFVAALTDDNLRAGGDRRRGGGGGPFRGGRLPGGPPPFGPPPGF